MIRETAYAKLNLALRVGRPRSDGLHPLCSIFASIELADEVEVAPADADGVECPGVPGPNLAATAVGRFRERVPGLPPLWIRIDKRIPVAAGLGGGSADAAAVLRAANRLAGDPLDADRLRGLAAGLGSDVPSQLEPRHALVSGTGEMVEPIELPALSAVVAPQADGLSTAAVYAEFDRLGLGREELGCAQLAERARELAGSAEPRPRGTHALAGGAQALAGLLHNDLQPAALSLRPELSGVLDSLRAAGAPSPLVSGSGPTCFALFEDPAAAAVAAAGIDGAFVTRLRLT